MNFHSFVVAQPKLDTSECEDRLSLLWTVRGPSWPERAATATRVMSAGY